ncbi:MAG: 5-(carboxyamino)imidazole ribonucleotide mutase [Candidatus Ratteibacteria bacterium]
MKPQPCVAIIVGSKTDLPFLEGATSVLEEFGVAYSVEVMSAHRSLDKVSAFASSAEENGFEVIIAVAGMAAHLPGVIAAKTVLPVIGVPLPTSDIKGMDSLLAIVQMPGGIPVATMAIGKAGVKNAALFAVAILARREKSLLKKLQKYRESIF